MTSSPGRRETRRFSRRETLIPVVVRAAGNKVEAGIRLDSLDLSEGGAFLRSDLLFEVGEELSLDISLGTGQVLTATGRVAWVTRGTDVTAAGMGIAFTRLPEETRRSLASSLRELTRGGRKIPGAHVRS